jgi:hypothetical protein
VEKEGEDLTFQLQQLSTLLELWGKERACNSEQVKGKKPPIFSMAPNVLFEKNTLSFVMSARWVTCVDTTHLLAVHRPTVQEYLTCFKSI